MCEFVSFSETVYCVLFSPEGIFPVSLSEPHTRETALQDTCVYVYLQPTVWPYTENLNWTNGFEICAYAKSQKLKVFKPSLST